MPQRPTRPLVPARSPLGRVVPMVAACLFGLVACGGDDAPVPAPRPVLVATPGDATPGTVAFAGEVRARAESVLAFRVGGKIVARSADVGDAVPRGALLAELDPGDLRLQAGALAAQLSAARAELRRAAAERARFASLADDQLVSRSALDAAESAHAVAAGQVRALEAQLDVARNEAAYAQLRAPVAGAIAVRHAEVGQVVAAGQPVFTLAAEAGRDVVIAIPEGRIDDIAVGQPVQVELWSKPGRRIAGTVREVAPVADPLTRTWQARIALRGDETGAVALGQTAQVFLPREDADAGMSVPLAAVQRDENDATAVWVVDPEQGVVHLVPVALGPYGSTRVPVVEGLAPDALVVVAGGHLLREGQPVRAVGHDNRPATE